jgi:hypothetical protein
MEKNSKKTFDWVKSIDPKEIGCEDVDWIHLTPKRDQWQALVDTVMNLWVP